MPAEALIADQTPTDTWQWWEARRLRYNLGLAVAGVLAGGLTGLVIWSFRNDPSPVEVPWPAILIHGLLYLGFMAAANACYLIGAFSEKLLTPRDTDAYRRRMWRLGFGFSMALPFAYPAWVLFVMMMLSRL
ncbi:hypothetical protein KOAAANKH_01617 [Brevundimonas sp. NIBR10]|nr:hypothetical protein KOAAANKH_01617 [Brevundimonas sp. NIBR10]